MSEPSRSEKYDWEIVDIHDNGEFLSWATLVMYKDGVLHGTQIFTGTSEEPPGYSGEELARSCAIAWHEVMTTTIEERLGQYGLEFQREQEERRNAG